MGRIVSPAGRASVVPARASCSTCISSAWLALMPVTARESVVPAGELAAVGADRFTAAHAWQEFDEDTHSQALAIPGNGIGDNLDDFSAIKAIFAAIYATLLSTYR